MRNFLKILGILVGIIVLLLIGAEVQTVRMNSSHMAEQFATGKLPDPVPNGFFRGSADFYTASWQGKTFDFENHRGINNFGSEQNTALKYSFETNVGNDANIPGLQVYQIDYASSSNPFWVRPVLDSVVQIAPEQLLGKIQYRLIPGHPFTLGFFQLVPAANPTTQIRDIPVSGKYFSVKLPQTWNNKFTKAIDPQLSNFTATSKTNDTLNFIIENITSTTTSTPDGEAPLDSQDILFLGTTTTLKHFVSGSNEKYTINAVFEKRRYNLTFQFQKEHFDDPKQFLLHTISTLQLPSNK